ncbi:uncharacterized protein LOC122621448 [Drosophila teissieri]|uniref:uncharacterized protein LOC122621448 n=1 Tax=Drosophila teissieri TaxID=7243 RepID=UPI001CBA2538|nr:uncharacterized protein LOC122621448 [Drosophila teissieri]
MRLAIIFVLVLVIFAIFASGRRRRKRSKDKNKNSDWKKVGEAQTMEEKKGKQIHQKINYEGWVKQPMNAIMDEKIISN